MSEKFCLKWYDFEVNVTKSFRRLRYEDDFYDVTLVSSDKKLLSAHKVVLSSCSEYFRGILSQSKQANLLLCLEGISSVEVTNVLDYIYNGELQMPRDSLQRFLEIADRFQLEGLAGNAKGIIKTTENTDEELKKCIGSQSGLDNENWFWTNKTDFGEETMEDADEKVQKWVTDNTTPITIESQKQIFTESKKRNPNSRISRNAIVLKSDSLQNIDELEQKLCELMEKESDGMWRCLVCSKIFRKPIHMKEHVETHIDGLNFPCSYCDLEFRARSLRRNHYYKSHRQILRK